MNDAVKARAELEATLDELEERLNPAKVAARTNAKLRRSYRRNPGGWTAGAAAVVVVAGGALLLLLRRG
jgi:ferric-dicitrate binding protein FerR (iron transport regulator)